MLIYSHGYPRACRVPQGQRLYIRVNPCLQFWAIVAKKLPDLQYKSTSQTFPVTPAHSSGNTGRPRPRLAGNHAVHVLQSCCYTCAAVVPGTLRLGPSLSNDLPGFFFPIFFVFPGFHYPPPQRLMTNYVCAVLIMVGFDLFLFRRSQKLINFQKYRTQNLTIMPISSTFWHCQGRRSRAAEGWQGADATSMTPPCPLSTTAAC